MRHRRYNASMNIPDVATRTAQRELAKYLKKELQHSTCMGVKNLVTSWYMVAKQFRDLQEQDYRRFKWSDFFKVFPMVKSSFRQFLEMDINPDETTDFLYNFVEMLEELNHDFKKALVHLEAVIDRMG